MRILSPRMVIKSSKRLISALSAAILPLACNSLSAQSETSGQADSLVRLLSAKTLELIEKDGVTFRKAVGPTFLHNGTYLICDTSLWNVNARIINCLGNVSLIQGDTELTSETLDYLIDEDLAQFRGSLVQLRNKQGNFLRTRTLDYNTRDSVAIFDKGASMKSEDGQVIESDKGRYFNGQGLFRFEGNVNMFADSTFVRTTAMDYDSEAARADFTAYIDFWNDGNMLSASRGWYSRGEQIFFFRDEVHALSEKQEVWCDSLYYYQLPGDVLMLGRVQVQDSSRSVAALSGRMFYKDSLSRVSMRDNAAVAMWGRENTDTLYAGADEIVYRTVLKCDISEAEKAEAEDRLAEILGDPVSEYRRRAADEADAARKKTAESALGGAKAAVPPSGNKSVKDAADRAVKDNSAAAEKAPAPGGGQAGKSSDNNYVIAQNDSTALSDSLAVTGTDGLAAAPGDSLAVRDSLVSAAADSLAFRDSSKVGFLSGYGNVRVFRKDMQARCDSLVYCDLDSIARMYNDPVVWNGSDRQFSSDSLFVLVNKAGPDRASLLSNAFILIQEDSTYYDQIRSTDVLAFFDGDSQLRRFDALGGVNAMFYIKENEAIATVNKAEAKMLSATMKDGDVERVYYFQSPHNDAYPVVQLSPDEHRLKGFDWRPGLRPKSRTDITALEVKPSERAYYELRPKSRFRYTDEYFPGYMDDVRRKISESRDRKRHPSGNASGEPELPDGGRAVEVREDSVVAPLDSLGILTESPETARDTVEWQSPRELRRALRQARRDARWAELNAKDAAKAEARRLRAEAKARAREERKAAEIARQDARDMARLRKYIIFYQKEKDHNERKQQQKQQAPELAGERASRVE